MFSGQDILTTIKAKEPKEAIKELIVARRLLSGDLLLLTLLESARTFFKKNKEWL
jgi:hypothetical protein